MKTKLIALALMGVMSCSVLAGCSQGKVAEKDGKVYVYDGTWPEESAVDGVKIWKHSEMISKQKIPILSL